MAMPMPMAMAMGVRRLCLWPYGYAYGPMDITMAPMYMTLCLWPYAYSYTYGRGYAYGAYSIRRMRRQNIGYRDGA